MAKCTKKTKNCSTVALKRNQEHNNNAAQPAPPPAPPPAKDGQTSKRPKGKASPDKRTPAKRPRIATETDLHVKVPSRKVRETSEGPSHQNKNRRRDGEETPPSLLGTGGDVRKNEEKKKAPADPPPQKRQTKMSPTKHQIEERSEGTSQQATQQNATQPTPPPAKDRQEDVRKNEDKKKAPADPPPQKRQRKMSPTKHQSDECNEGMSQQATRQKTKQDSDAQGAAFLAKYREMDKLGDGGFGSVFAGHRRSDNLPVAVKHIPKDRVHRKHVGDDGQEVPMEVAIMMKLSSVGSSAPVSLLDWYELKQELILVLERPDPCVDLFTYVLNKRGYLPESEAQIIMKQLVDAAKELEDHEIFHQDIKIENILIETGSDVPRVRLIDFGQACFIKKGSFYDDYSGVIVLFPPELMWQFTYRASPITVWQLGVVLFDTLHRHRDRNDGFMTIYFLDNKLKIKKRLSEDCRDVLENCLALNPEHRPTLEQLQCHPWLR